MKLNLKIFAGVVLVTASLGSISAKSLFSKVVASSHVVETATPRHTPKTKPNGRVLMQGSNPHVPYRTPVDLTPTGAEATISGSWDIQGFYPSPLSHPYVGTVATDSNPAGWNVTYQNSKLRVSAPSGAMDAQGFKVRYYVQNPAANKSATFNLQPKVSPGGFFDFWIPTGGTPPGSGLQWDILKGTNVVATSNAPNGWAMSPVGGHSNISGSPYHIALQLPAAAALGSDYVFRMLGAGGNDGWSTTAFSGGFDVSLGFSTPSTIVPNPPLGFLPDSMTLPDWMNDLIPTDETSAPAGDTSTGSGGPSAALSVELVHGVVTADSGPDIVTSNPVGPDVPFERLYRSALAAGHLSSPGFPSGWAHNWDYRLVALSPLNAQPIADPPLFARSGPSINSPARTSPWNGLQFIYPSGASELLSPHLNNDGTLADNNFTVPSGAP